MSTSFLCSCGDDEVKPQENGSSGSNSGGDSSGKSGTNDGHEWIDLGLPSGTLWATCNVGASSPEESGSHFAWGETQPKNRYSWSTYGYCNGSENTMVKYCNDGAYGYMGFTDNLTNLLSEDDAATANWGSEWQMPSREQIEELFNSFYTNKDWTQLNDKSGWKITSKKTGNSIFLPYAKVLITNNSWSYGSSYLSNSLCTPENDKAYVLFFNDYYTWSFRSESRCLGCSVRPVRKQ